MTVAKVLKNHVRGPEGRMTAQIHLDGGSKPAQVESRFALHDKCGFRKVVLGRDRLKRGIRQPVG